MAEQGSRDRLFSGSPSDNTLAGISLENSRASSGRMVPAGLSVTRNKIRDERAGQEDTFQVQEVQAS